MAFRESSPPQRLHPTRIRVLVMNKNYTWKFLSLVACLLMSLFVVSCQKEKDEITEEQARIVFENAEVVMDKVSEMYEASETVEEMEQHLAEIRAMPNVEDAYRDDIAICVKIKDGGIIMWCFYPDPEEEEDKNDLDFDELLKNTSKSVSSFKGGSLCEEKSICILNVLYDDYELGNVSGYEMIESAFDALKWKYCVRKNKEVTPDFIIDTMPDYGMTIINTHGLFSDSQHWLMTGQLFSDIKYLPEYKELCKSWKDDLHRIMFVSDDGHIAISESVLDILITKKFPRNSILFLDACQTLKGNNSLWLKLKSKGLGCMLGYTESVYWYESKRCLRTFMEKMIDDGATTSEACASANDEISYLRHRVSGLNLLCYPENSDIILVEKEPVGDDWVDLGLPSGLLWASRNVGATSPEDYGDQFAWGETTPKSVYDWSTYRYCNGYNNMNYLKLTKYCNNSHYGEMGFTDNLTIIQPDDDAATANYGGRTPTIEEWQELGSNTTSRWTFINGVYGQILTGSNGNSLFLPDRDYWSSLLYTYHPLEAWYVYFDTYRQYNYGSNRCNGLFVRAVLSAQ